MQEIRIYKLNEKELRFPPVDLANKDGILAYGGDLSPKRVLLAYHKGIFPWYSEETPILWWCPDPRFVLFPDELHVSKSTRRLMRKGTFEVTFDKDFEQVLKNCKQMPRKDQDGTWITEELFNTYIEIHAMGYAHSVEVWQNGELVGGLFGVNIGGVYFGESMFTKVSNASKVGFASLVVQLQKRGVQLIDCQVWTAHLESFGARHIKREKFMHNLDILLEAESLNGSWSHWLDD